MTERLLSMALKQKTTNKQKTKTGQVQVPLQRYLKYIQLIVVLVPTHVFTTVVLYSLWIPKSDRIRELTDYVKKTHEKTSKTL